MLSGVIEWLKNLTIFMVVCETLLSFAPTFVYKRYIKPFVGLVMILWITSFLFGEVTTDWDERVEEIFADYETSVSQYLKDFSILQEKTKEAKTVLESDWNAEEVQEKTQESWQEERIKIEDIQIGPIWIGEAE